MASRPTDYEGNLAPNLDNIFLYGTDCRSLRQLPVVAGTCVCGRQAKLTLKPRNILDTHKRTCAFFRPAPGEVFTPLEFVESQPEALGKALYPVHERVLEGEPLGKRSS